MPPTDKPITFLIDMSSDMNHQDLQFPQQNKFPPGLDKNQPKTSRRNQPEDSRSDQLEHATKGLSWVTS